MKIRVEKLPTIPVVYMRRTGAYGEQNYRLMQEMKVWIQARGLSNSGGDIYGIAQDNATVTPPEQCRYDVCFATEKTFDDAAIQHGEISSGTYLVFEIPHTAEEVGRFWACIGNVMEEQGRQVDERRPILERYPFALVERGCCEFCVPVLA